MRPPIETDPTVDVRAAAQPSGVRPSRNAPRAPQPRPTAAVQSDWASMAERQDLAHLAAFYRRARLPALLGWLVWVPFDCALTMMYPGTFARSLMVRAVAAAGMALAFSGLLRARSYRAMTAWLVALAVIIHGAIGVVATRLGGLHSPYHVGPMVVLAVLGFSPLPWRRVLPIGLAAWAVYPAVVLGDAALDPSQRAELHTPGAWVPLAASTVVGLLIVALACIGASLSWTLRRQVFESRSIGRYQLRRRLGAGGMGEVWAAWHKGLQREVAVKMLRNEGDPRATERFEREVRAMTELTHPNTVRVFDYGVTDDGITYYAMELLEGADLVGVVAREGPMLPERVVYLAAQAARALAEAHARAMVHRDVKPENLFLTVAGGERDFVKVLDFGIVRREAEGDHLTQTGAITGTPAYIAPEVVRGEPATPRADVYALGGVMYFLLAGRHVFEAQGAVAQLLAQLNSPVEAPSRARGEPIAADVEALVLRCLEKDPRARFADAAELADALAACSLAGVWRPAMSARAGTMSIKPASRALATTRTVEAPKVDVPVARSSG